MEATVSDLQKIIVSLSASEIIVEPGNGAQLVVTMTNQQDSADRLSLEVEGVDVEWYAIPVPAVNVAPGVQTSERILFKVARSSENRAGSYPFLVRVQAMETGEVGVAQATLVVKPFNSLQMELNPKRAVATFLHPLNDFDATISNLGNADETLDLYASDPEDGCAYEFDTDRITLKPGQSQMVPLAIRPKVTSMLGGVRLYGFTVSSRSVEDSYVSANASGQVEKHALISPLLGIFLLLLGITGVGWWFFQPKPVQPIKINAFNASSLKIDSGGESVLTWDVSGDYRQIIIFSKVKGQQEVAEGEQHVAVGSIHVKPQYPETTYTLILRGAGKTRQVAADVKIAVAPPVLPPKPVIAYFAADPPAIHQGETVMFKWKGNNISQFILDPGGAKLSQFEETLSVKPDQDQDVDYTLRAIGILPTMKPASKTVHLHIVPANVCLAQIKKFAAVTPEVFAGDKVRLKWSTLYAKNNIRIESDHGEPIAELPRNGSIDVVVTDTTNFKLTATDSLGLTVSQTVTVTAKPKPVVPETPPTTPPGTDAIPPPP